MRELPRPASTFSSLRRPGHLYFDRTEPIFRLAAAASPTMVCRPAGFGKSLACSALQCLLKGRRELFEGLWIESAGWSWAPHEVIHLRLLPGPDAPRGSPERSPERSTARRLDLAASMSAALIGPAAAAAGPEIVGGGPGKLLRSLMGALHEKSGRKVAVIIDDVDAPLWPALGRPDDAAAALEALGDLLSALEGPEPWRGPVFLAGTLRLPLGPAPGRPGLPTLRDATFDRSMASFGGLTAQEIRALADERLESDDDRRKAYALLDGPGGYLPPFFADPTNLIMDLWGGCGWGGPVPLANTRRVLDFFRAAPDGDSASRRVRQGLIRTPIEPRIARFLAGALDPSLGGGPEDSAGLAGVSILRTPRFPPRGGPAIDPGRPDPVSLARQIGLLATSRPNSRHFKNSMFPDGGIPTLDRLREPYPGMPKGRPNYMRSAAWWNPRRLSPPNLSALAELGRLVFNQRPTIEIASDAWHSAVRVADSLHRELSFNYHYDKFRAAWSAVSPDDPDSAGRRHQLIMLALALAGMPFKARGTLGDPFLSLRIDAEEGTLVMLSSMLMERRRGLSGALNPDALSAMIEWGRGRLSRKLEDAIRREDLRRGGRRIVKFLLVGEAATGCSCFIEDDPD